MPKNRIATEASTSKRSHQISGPYGTGRFQARVPKQYVDIANDCGEEYWKSFYLMIP